MTEAAPAIVADSPGETPAKPKKKEDSFLVFLLKLVVVVVLFRTLLFTSFMIPSESMMPRLLVGDYLFASKWPYGYSGASLPIDWNNGKGRIFGSLPERGDIVIFKHPIDRSDYVKRVIGLPGDTVQVIGGVLHLNGQPVRKERIGDFIVPIETDGRCRGVQFTTHLADGTAACRYPRFRETLPNGVTYSVLDLGQADISYEFGVDADNTVPVIVPENHVFMMGDNRDNSLDSRFPAVAEKGVGIVPVENLVGRASFMFFSTDGTAEWVKPWTWFTAARWDRIGRSI